MIYLLMQCFIETVLNFAQYALRPLTTVEPITLRLFAYLHTVFSFRLFNHFWPIFGK